MWRKPPKNKLFHKGFCFNFPLWHILYSVSGVIHTAHLISTYIQKCLKTNSYFFKCLCYLPLSTPMHCRLFAPTRARCGQINLPHKYVYKWQKNNKIKNSRHFKHVLPFPWHCKSYIPFIRWDINAIGIVVTLRDHFHIFGTVVHNVSPGQAQKRLHKTFKDLIVKVVIVGGVKGIHSQCNNIIYTRKTNCN